jgi:hypothetical protein
MTSRQLWPKIITSPVAIISIHLEGMGDVPSLLAYHHMFDWLHGNVVHVSLDFHFADVPQNDFESRLNAMLVAFEKKGPFEECVSITLIIMRLIFVLLRWTQFMVFITTHSDPETGYLHIMPKNGGSAPVQDVNHFFFSLF